MINEIELAMQRSRNNLNLEHAKETLDVLTRLNSNGAVTREQVTTIYTELAKRFGWLY